MRAFSVVIVLFTAGALAWSWSRSGDPIKPPAAGPRRDATPLVAPAPPHDVTAREAVPATARARDAVMTSPNASSAATPDALRAAEPEATTSQTTTIEVLSAASNQALDAFRWSCQEE